jgi:hypothetical protein
MGDEINKKTIEKNPSNVMVKMYHCQSIFLDVV